MSKLRPLRAMVIGAGPAAVAMHLPVLARLRDAREIELVLVCDLQRERAASARKTFGFLEESGDGVAGLQRPDIDVVYILGSAQLHYAYGLMALGNDKHLFVEKPIAPSHAQACELAAVAQSRGLIAVGGHNRRFHESLAAVRSRAGKAGWRFAEAVFHKPESGKPPLFGARTWLGANGIHALDALVFMMGGVPEHMTAFAGDAGMPQPASFIAVMRWRDGAQGAFLCNNHAGARREEYVFHAPGETCTVTATELLLEKDGAVTRTPLLSTGDGISAEHKSFLQAVRNGIAPPHAIEALAPSLFLAELIEAGFSGRVTLPQSVSAQAGAGGVAAHSVLVVRPERLQSMLGQLLPCCRLVSLEDVRESAGPRPEITAAILGHGSDPLPQDILEKLPGLAIVAVVGLSVARYKPEMLFERDIALVHASSAYAESVAEFALALAVLGRRRAFVSHEIMRQGGWGNAWPDSGPRTLLRRAVLRVRPVVKAAGLESFCLGLWRRARPLVEGAEVRTVQTHDLQGALVGLIGWGANARAFAARLIRAHARVLVYSERASPEDIQRAGAIPVSLAEALAADIVSLHRGLTKQTRHCLGTAELARLRPGALLINVARGALIEPRALLLRLQRGDIFACLDTFEEEPLPGSHPLRRLPNVFLTSHIAGGSPDMLAAAAEEVVRKVAAYLNGGTIEPISAQQLRAMT